jgi:translation elongation factor EF-G
LCISGYYIGIGSAIIFESLTLSTIVLRLKWNEEVERAALVTKVDRADANENEEPNDKTSKLGYFVT